MSESITEQEHFKLSDCPNDTPLYLKAYRKLRELIINEYYTTGDKLMSEARLADYMGIGRTSLRTALVLLSEDGYIKTLQGKGTYVVYEKEACSTKYPDAYLLPRQRLLCLGNKKIISHTNVNQYTTDFDSFLNDTLHANNEPINLFMRNYTLDGNPAILMNAYYRSSLFPDIDFEDFDKTEMLLTKLFETKISYVTSSILAAPDPSSRKLNNFHEQNNNFLLVSSVWYDQNDTPLVFTKDHYNGNYIAYTIRSTTKPSH